jgi:uncharacterized protein
VKGRSRQQSWNESDKTFGNPYIIGAVSFSEISDLLDAAQHRLGREVNPSVYPVDEFVAKVVAGHHFVTSLIREPKIFLIGDEDDFGRLAEKPMGG